MLNVSLRPAHREGDLLALSGAHELNARRQQDRLAEADIDRESVGQAALEGPEATGLRPHAVRDGARKAKGLRSQRVHVDRVAVPRDAGVAAAEVTAESPLGAYLQLILFPRPAGIDFARCRGGMLTRFAAFVAA